MEHRVWTFSRTAAGGALISVVTLRTFGMVVEGTLYEYKSKRGV
jgi:hypothetical protein